MCSHTIIDDSIDLTIERSMTIYYCTICHACFNRDELDKSDIEGIYTIKLEPRQSDSENP